MPSAASCYPLESPDLQQKLCDGAKSAVSVVAAASNANERPAQKKVKLPMGIETSDSLDIQVLVFRYSFASHDDEMTHGRCLQTAYP